MVKESALHGRGVFAKTAISRGGLIEAAPAVFLSGEEKEMLRNSPLFNYYFLVTDPVYPAAFGFGYTSFYNHSPRANAFYTFSNKRSIIWIFAYKRIMAGEEITINYSGRPDDDKPAYFPE
ncbi:MAG TPA: SET domain-containing protein-lysine N-methyltransferase [Puia sp.]|nr:SET domain-containing protein-lysine N-methyltransferase [Puia sp.]